MPTAAAARGSRLAAVKPGSVLTSRHQKTAVFVHAEVDAAVDVELQRPMHAQREILARAVCSGVSSAGKISSAPPAWYFAA